MTLELDAATIIIITCFLDFTHWQKQQQQQQQQLITHENILQVVN